MQHVFAGLDWAAHTHAVCVIDTAGGVLERFEIGHDREGLAELMHRLARFGARIRIAIERPSGLIVDALVEAGHHVFPIHPNAVKASRPRYRSHGAKSDASDAYLLADLLRTEGEEGHGMLLHQAVQRGLFRAVTLVVDRRTIGRPVGLPADGLQAWPPRLWPRFVGMRASGFRSPDRKLFGR